MNILLVSSEVVPFAKTGGLADVCGTLPQELARLGHQTIVMLPAHRDAAAAGLPLDETGIELEVAIGAKQVRGSLLHSTLPGSSVPVYLVHQPDYFDRPGIYGDSAGDYEDNCERFVFFCRAVLQAMARLDLEIDLVHLNDWPTGLIPAYLRIEHAGDPAYERIATLFTIHNLAYQGTFWHWDMLLTGLDWKYFNWRQMEFHGQLNFLKTGLVFADAINTVSPQYAQEIQTPPLGCHLEDLLRHRHETLSGIINGVDYSVWNPATDLQIAARYDETTFGEGKAACKAELQKELGLSVAAEIPLLGIVGRLVDQKGLDLILPTMRKMAPTGKVQWAVLGSGSQELEEELRQLAAEFPRQIAACIGFSDQLAHRIEAGADLFVMPSRYEPCGLNQLYSLKYGTVPLVRQTGGLADTVTDTTPETLADKTATGFSFVPYSSDALLETLNRACDLFHNDPSAWQQIVRTGMRQDWSWSRSAQQYAALYEVTVASRRAEAVEL